LKPEIGELLERSHKEVALFALKQIYLSTGKKLQFATCSQTLIQLLTKGKMSHRNEIEGGVAVLRN